MVDAPKDSILNTVKKMLGIDAAYTHFDTDVMIHINSAFSTLHQLGLGPVNTLNVVQEFEITDEFATWDQFIAELTGVNSVRSYVYYKVKLVFDPPATSFAQKAMEDAAKEIEWRLNVAAEAQRPATIPEPASEE